MKRKRESDWRCSVCGPQKKEEKTQICQAGVMTKTMRSGTPPVSSDTGRSTLINSSVHQAIWTDTSRRGLVWVRIRGHKSAAVDCICEEDYVRKREASGMWSVVYWSSQSQAGGWSHLPGAEPYTRLDIFTHTHALTHTLCDPWG